MDVTEERKTPASDWVSGLVPGVSVEFTTLVPPTSQMQGAGWFKSASEACVTLSVPMCTELGERKTATLVVPWSMVVRLMSPAQEDPSVAWLNWDEQLRAKAELEAAKKRRLN